MDNTHKERLAGLQRGVRAATEALLENLVALGSTEPWRPVVVYGLRSAATQEQLYRQGRERRLTLASPGKYLTTWVPGGSGRIVTRARPWQSAHCFGLAADIALVSDSDSAWLEDSHPAWQVLGREAEALGLEWGGRWKFYDAAHVQARDWESLVADEIVALKGQYT